MYQEGDLKLYFKDLFSRNISTKQRNKKNKTLASQNKTKTHERFYFKLEKFNQVFLLRISRILFQIKRFLYFLSVLVSRNYDSVYRQ